MTGSDREIVDRSVLQTENEMTQRDERMGFWQVMGSVLAALLGVQSEKNRQRDFTSGSPFAFIAVGAVATVVLIGLIWLGVRLLLAQAGHPAF
jgi:hypothetical protein